MGETRIEYVTTSWNPVTGCSPVSEGCTNCYARRMAHRLAHIEGSGYGNGVDSPNPAGAFDVRLRPERLEEPLRWRKPRRVFVCSMSDLFHDEVPFQYIESVFNVMDRVACRDHVFLVLTKRPDRMAEFIPPWWDKLRENGVEPNMHRIWLGVTAENQARADERIPVLLEIPAAVRWVSCEPLLGPIELHDYLWAHHHGTAASYQVAWAERGGIHWVVAGGETGPGARPCHPHWVRSLRDQCQQAGVPFFFKRWGAWVPVDALSEPSGRRHVLVTYKKDQPAEYCAIVRAGKGIGRLLDGEEWNEFPTGGETCRSRA